jgi:hypothetical protein
MSTSLTGKAANIPVRKAQEYTNSLRIQHYGTFSTYPDRRFFIRCPDSPCTAVQFAGAAVLIFSIRLGSSEIRVILVTPDGSFLPEFV